MHPRSTLLAAALLIAPAGCGTNLLYVDTMTQGVPNYHVLAPDLVRAGVPTTPDGWDGLRRLVEKPGRSVTKVVLHDAAEADESPAVHFGWNLVLDPLPPYGDKPLTVFEMPATADIVRAARDVLDAWIRGDVVVFGCVHDRERGGLIAALLGIVLFDWSDAQAWDYMIATGSRIEETPGLLARWVELTREMRKIKAQIVASGRTR